MRETRLTIPEVGIIAGTRGLLGAGIGLLLADRVPESRRRTVGWTLFSIGALSTLPIVMLVLGRSRRVRSAGHDNQDRVDDDASNHRTHPLDVTESQRRSHVA